MSWTEKEALTKWCPYKRIVCVHKASDVMKEMGSTSFNYVAVNGQPEPHPASKCIGTGCMKFEETKTSKESLSGACKRYSCGALASLSKTTNLDEEEHF